MNTVELKSIYKDYMLGESRILALSDVSYELRDKKFTVLTGKSGSGKTTLLNIIGCLDSPTSGELFISGVNTSVMSDDELSEFRSQKLGFIFQNFNLIPVLSCFENVEYPLLFSKLSKRERKERVDYLLSEVGLGDFANHTPNQLSGGQRQRTAIARALVHNPKLILADEPTANLDSATSASILLLMKKMQKEEGVTFLLSSHDPDVLDVADERIRISDGKLHCY